MTVEGDLGGDQEGDGNAGNAETFVGAGGRRLRRPRPRQPGQLPQLVLHQPSVKEDGVDKVRITSEIEKGSEKEEVDGDDHLAVGCAIRFSSDPAADLRPRGFISKFWELEDDDDSVIMPQSPLTLDLVRQAAVHGFTKEHLVEAEMALQDSSVERRVEAALSPATADKKVALVNFFFQSWGDRRSSMAPWSGKLPQPRTSPLLTLGECSVVDRRRGRSTMAGSLDELLQRSSSPCAVTLKQSPVRRTSAPENFQKLDQVRSGFHALVVGPDCVNLGPGGTSVCRRRRPRKLAERFCVPGIDVVAANAKTLAAAPFVSYVQVVRRGMAQAGAGGMGSGGGGSEGDGAGRGFQAGRGGRKNPISFC